MACPGAWAHLTQRAWRVAWETVKGPCQTATLWTGVCWGPGMCPREAGVTDPALPVPGASGAVSRVPVALAHTRSVCQRDVKHTFSFPVIPSHCESPFRRDFPPGLTQAASRPVTQAGALPAQSPHPALAGTGTGRKFLDPQRRPTAAPAKANHNLGVVLQACGPCTVENQEF